MFYRALLILLSGFFTRCKLSKLGVLRHIHIVSALQMNTQSQRVKPEPTDTQKLQRMLEVRCNDGIVITLLGIGYSVKKE